MGLFKKFVKALNDAINEDEPKKPVYDYDEDSSDEEMYDDYDEDIDDDYDEDIDDDYDEDIDESDLNSEFDEEDYDYSELASEQSDPDLEELGRNVDQLIESTQGNLSSSDRQMLQDQAVQYGLSAEEFNAILDSRLEELRYAIEAGYEPQYVYRTRSVWRRCPNCGWLNSADDVYCEWCGYQLRHRAASFLLASLVMAGAHGNRSKLHSRHVKKSVKKANKGRKSAKKVKPKAGKTLSARKKVAKPVAKKPLGGSKTTSTAKPAAKKSLFGSKSTTTVKPAEKKSLFGSKTTSSAKPAEKKSLFGSKSTSTVKPAAKKSLFGGSSSKPKKSGGLLGGSKKSGGLKLGGKRRR